MKTIWLDMDGTIANLYGQDNWLPRLIQEDEQVYNCECLYNTSELVTAIKLLNRKYNIGIITWTSKGGTKDFNKRVRQVKLEWLKDNGIVVDIFHCIKYGTPKNKYMNNGDILIDDEQKNIDCANRKGNGILTNGKDLIEILYTL